MTGSDATIGGDLTPREREVLAMVAAGLTNREIGEALFISESTAGVHVSHLMAKLGVGSRTEAAAWAYRAGLVETAPAQLPIDPSPADAALSPAPQPPAGWFGRLIARLRQRDGRVAAMSIGGVVVLGAIAAGLAIAALNAQQPAVGDLPSPSASSSSGASASSNVEASASATVEPSTTPSIKASPAAATPGPTPIPLPKGTWSITRSMAVNRTAETATLLDDGTVLVAGGASVTGESQASAELYHPDSGEWTTTGEMVEGRYYHSATLLDDGTVLVAGGSYSTAQGGPQTLATAELFDPATGRWRATAPMNTARASHTATLLGDGTVLVAGGSAAGSPGTATAEVYDPRTATWTSVAPMADGRMSHTATRLNDGTVLIVGGSTSGGGASVARAALYDPDSQTWSDAGRLGVGRYSHTATLLADGTVLVAGGSSDIGSQASAEIYHPSTNAWTPARSMAEPRAYGPTATVLHDGTVLVVGGAFPDFASVEVYDPRNAEWVSAAPLPNGRSWHLATLLANGDVLISGGGTSGGGMFVASFLYGGS